MICVCKRDRNKTKKSELPLIKIEENSFKQIFKLLFSFIFHFLLTHTHIHNNTNN